MAEEERGLATIEKLEEAVVPIKSVVGQVAYIQEVMKAVMKKDEHYGVIPGVEKPSLFKPGAEKLCTSFRLDPEYETTHFVEQDRFILKEVRCTLYHIPTGLRIASGEGSANSREEKWRYRNVTTDEPVPKAYWEARSKNDVDTMREIMGADGTPKKKGGAWFIARRMENDNPYDLHNTILKMACKRALVAAVLNATGASDIFTQDVEDLGSILNEVDVESESKGVFLPSSPEAADSTSTVKETEGGGVFSPPSSPPESPPSEDKKMGLTELRREIYLWTMEMADSDEEVATKLVKQHSAFKGKDGKEVSTGDVGKLSLNWARRVHHGVKEAHAKWVDAHREILQEEDDFDLQLPEDEEE